MQSPIMAAMLMVFVLPAIIIALYARTVYGLIPPGIGGGQAIVVRVIAKPGGSVRVTRARPMGSCPRSRTPGLGGGVAGSQQCRRATVVMSNRTTQNRSDARMTRTGTGVASMWSTKPASPLARSRGSGPRISARSIRGVLRSNSRVQVNVRPAAPFALTRIPAHRVTSSRRSEI